MPTRSWLIGPCVVSLGMACARETPRADTARTRAAQPTPTDAQHDWVITPRGLGPLRVGMTRAEAEAAVGGSLAIDGDSAWTDCGYTPSDHLPAGVHVMVESGTIARIDVDSGSIATEAGARIGDSEERIRRLYAGRVATTPQKYTDGHYLTVTPATAADTVFRIVFESDSGRVKAYRAGRLPAVEYVERCG